ncbi:MAG: hypothetical protein IH880_01130 [Candidatus Marinimicrobia bacterium]|nr:hypothetical protein [Candidatus Neomarinimicrobiota bacterium]
MSINPDYSKYHPKWFRKSMPIFWWTRKWVHMKFILRELTSVAVAYSAFLLLLIVRALNQGSEHYFEVTAMFKSPVILILHTVMFLFLIFHSVSWFSLAPKAIVLRIGKKRIPDQATIGLNFLAWFAVSSVIVWFI